MKDLELIKQLQELIYLCKIKTKYYYMDDANKKAFDEIEKEHFKKWDNTAYTFQQQNTVFYLVGEYVEKKQHNYYENDIIKDCLKVLGVGC